MRIIPLVVSTVSQEVYFDEDTTKAPGYELSIRATYRDLPIEGLHMLQNEIASLVKRVTDKGQELNADASNT